MNPCPFSRDNQSGGRRDPGLDPATHRAASRWRCRPGGSAAPRALGAGEKEEEGELSNSPEKKKKETQLGKAVQGAEEMREETAFWGKGWASSEAPTLATHAPSRVCRGASREPAPGVQDLASPRPDLFLHPRSPNRRKEALSPSGWPSASTSHQGSPCLSKIGRMQGASPGPPRSGRSAGAAWTLAGRGRGSGPRGASGIPEGRCDRRLPSSLLPPLGTRIVAVGAPVPLPSALGEGRAPQGRTA